MQQGVQTDTTYNIQQCCVRLYKAFGLRNPFNNKVVKFQKPRQASLSLKWPHGYTKRALIRPTRLLSCERRSNHGATAIENGKKAIGLGPVCILEVQPPSTINFSQRLYEKKVQPTVRNKSWQRSLIELIMIASSWPGWASQSVYTENSEPGWPA